ncbi:DUF421 domain-containing protein [Fictibacillus nanhaiensis]|uniref:DUF421 domain-containing protein n=1 Tax=Fictibacillus nanhaiensis TaxID=742169 RepID=UPI001C981095|nr:DUF421 domain-containing protein [Fictibacillus nanhaiensis]MBY6036587.1 DUF421 domain-containing protein [Fictibacillus nanhaiensis]
MVLELLTVAMRIFTIIPLLLVATLYMGRRSIGELPVFDFLIIITLGAVVGADIADPKIEHIHTAVAVVLIAILQKTVIYLKIKFRKFGKLITFEPVMVVYEGEFMKSNLKKIKYSVENILSLLREKDIYYLEEVRAAFIEPNGNISVIKKSGFDFVTKNDLQITDKENQIAYPVIIEGRIHTKLLNQLGFSEKWLMERIENRNMNLSSVFYASLTIDGKLHVSQEHALQQMPDLLH